MFQNLVLESPYRKGEGLKRNMGTFSTIIIRRAEEKGVSLFYIPLDYGILCPIDMLHLSVFLQRVL